MSGPRLFLALIRWDIVRELRRRDVVLNMTLFAVLILFLAQLGVGPDRGVAGSIGPVIFWVTVVFTGTVGLSQSFAAEREGGRLAGFLLAPVDLGVFYLAKVAAAWLYTMSMEVLLLGAYVLLFGFDRWDLVGPLLLVMAVFTLGYIGAGMVLSSMTTSLRGGGEVVLRILLVPLMIPMVYLTLLVSESVFGSAVAGGALGPPVRVGTYLAVAGAFDAIYLASGFLVFPKVLEE